MAQVLKNLLFFIVTAGLFTYYLILVQSMFIPHFQLVNYRQKGEKQIKPKQDRITPSLEIKKNIIYITNYAGSRDGRRLGNHLFNVASLIGIAERNNMVPILFPRSRVLKDIDVNIKIFKEKSFSGIRYLHFREKAARRYDNRTENLRLYFKLKPHSTALINLHGYFQSWKYFYKNRSRVVDLIKFKPQTKNEATVTIQKLLSNDKFKRYMKKNIQNNHTNCKVHNSTMGILGIINKTFFNNNMYCSNVKIIGMHVRMGDFLSPNLRRAGYVHPGLNYYKHAIEYIKNNIYPNDFLLILICSDDITWSKKHLDGDNVMFSENPNRTAIMDLKLLSLCDSVIMSFSSYSFWGAYFSGGPTVYYKHSLKPKSVADRQCNKTEFLLPTWIGIA